MSRVVTPELRKYMEKKLVISLNGNRKVTGVLRGYDPFLNLVVDDAIEEKKDNRIEELGMIVIRGNSVVSMEAIEPMR
ncbi:hypothetical protein SeMB42_g02429 [Synchytrium endobioticum]|uniref:Small nuclear ribonucleoprotein G n=1 Tax=Synchytrium endobioticum TaxID=286115 RepID=A0A507DED3_9FUNG|nr:hypothetical protein SeLEV6574_g03867 [Synchytrium endobioticum]TPX49943.1 hypothetical protein SeMB42_g02429 [Synchytrium endobioticum]